MTETEMNLRKIHKSDYSRLVSLPLFWLDSVGLDAGDYVEIKLGDNLELVINPVPKQNDVEEVDD
jgi:antitoxin component of MazEF toxin-antitoxin module